jgi:ABC-type cobalt transport system substrate-binding protein
MVKCYQYTADGYFAGEVEDYGLLPNNATRTAPTIVEGKVLRWTGEKWEQVEDHKGKRGYVNGQPHEVKEYGPLPDGWSDTPPAPTRAELYTAKQTEIRNGAESMLTALAAEYAPLERQTWDQQAAEAEALQADADAPAPLVRAIAATRGMPVGELAARILANRRAWVAVSGHVVGQRLAYQDTLEATRGLDDAQAAETIQDINPVYTLPEDA